MRGQRALGDVLVQAPVVEVRDPQTQQKGRPRQHLVIRGQEHVHPYLVQFPETVNRPGILGKGFEAHGAGFDVFHKSKLIRRSAEFLECENHDNRTAEDQRAALNQVGPGARLQSAGRHVHHRNKANHQSGFRHRNIVAHLARHRVDRQRPGVGDRAQQNHVDEKCRHRHDRPRRGIVADFQKLRHRIDARPQEVRQKGKSHDHERYRRHPFVAGNRQADVAGRVAAHAHQLLRGNISGNQGESDQPPFQAPAGQEVVFTGLLVPAFPKPDGDHRGNKSQEYRNVQEAKFHNNSFPIVLFLHS